MRGFVFLSFSPPLVLEFPASCSRPAKAGRMHLFETARENRNPRSRWLEKPISLKFWVKNNYNGQTIWLYMPEMNFLVKKEKGRGTDETFAWAPASARPLNSMQGNSQRYEAIEL